MPRALGAFTIEAELGRGGMGVVYRAHDPLLNRKVAIKVIQTGEADLKWRQGRFGREARILASLNHPHIASIYTMDVQDDAVFLVLELVQGITLAKRIRQGALPVAEMASICSQVVAAMRAAHSSRVIHRDLKPENVMITPEGFVKVLDFGLAEVVADSTTRGPTDSTPLEPQAPPEIGDAPGSSAGSVMGTPRYLSPEQAVGQSVSEGTDVWQLGCIMYECLSGEVAFRGTETDALLAAIIEDSPDWTRLPRTTPARLVTLIKRCLEKDVEDRPTDLQEVESYLTSLRSAGNGRAGTIPGNLPCELTSFVGRARELDRIGELLASGPLVTIIGVGGTGKTRLSIAAARLFKDSYPGGTWLIELASLSDPDIVLQQIAHTVGVRQRSGHSLQDCLVEFFKEHDLPTLLLLDNCEHLLSPCADVCGLLLAHCPSLKIVASSREALGLPGEGILQLASLPTLDPSRGVPDTMAMEQCESIVLFLDRARSIQSEFGITERNKRAIAEICHRLDGIPLALELAAARLRILSVEQVADKLGHRFLLLTGGSRTALPRQQTLRALIDWSYDLLSDEEKALLRSLSVFRGGWTLAAASHVHQEGGGDEFEMLETMSRLVEKSLVLVDSSKDRPRYSFLETLRQYSRDRMIESGQVVELRGRHTLFFREFLFRAVAHSHDEDAKARMDELEREHDNLREAMDWCQSTDELREVGVEMACDISRFWELRGFAAEGRERLRGALESAQSVPVPVRARAKGVMASLLRELGQYAASMEASEEALELFRQTGDELGAANVKVDLGNVLWRTGKLADAERMLREVQPLIEAEGNPVKLSKLLRNLCIIELRRGNLDEADRLTGEAIAATRLTEDASTLGLALQLGGVIRRRLGDIPGAYQMHDEALRIMIALGARPGITTQLINLGNLAILEEDWLLARQFLSTALANARELGRKGTVAEALGALSDVYGRTGEADAALDAISECLLVCEESGDRQGQARALVRIASLTWNRKPSPEIVDLYLRSIELMDAVENKLELLMTMESCGEFALELALPGVAAEILAAVDSLYHEYAIQRLAEAAPTTELRTKRVRTALGEQAFETCWKRGRTRSLRETRSLIESIRDVPGARSSARDQAVTVG